MKQKTLFWAALFALLFILGAGYWLLRGGGEAVTAAVYVDGELYDT